MNYFRDSSIGSKLFLYGLYLSILPLIFAGLFIVQSIRKDLIAQAENELNIVSRAMGAEITQYVEELRNDASLLADLPTIQSMESDAQLPILENALAHYDRYGQLAIVDLNGQIQLTGREQQKINISHIDSFNVAATGEQAWVVAPALFNDSLVLHMHTPIWSDATQTEQVGVLGSPTRFQKIASILDKYDHDMPQSVFVLGSDDRVLIHLDPMLRETRPDYKPILKDAILVPVDGNRIESASSQTVNTVFNRGSERFVVSLTEIEEMGWTVVTQKKESVILAPLRAIQWIVGAIVCILMFLNILLLIYTRTRITDPVTTLATALSELEVGNTEAKLPNISRPNKEIFELIQAFSNMRAAVQEREHKLQEWSSTLEKKVEIRTAELQALNQYLEKEIDEHKRTAIELKKSRDEAQIANRVKDTFLARMSHELRTPLNVIIGYSELIHEFASDIDSDYLAEDATSISRAGRHLADIIGDVLTYSEIQSDSMQMSKENFFLDDVISDVQFAIDPMVKNNGNQVQINNHFPHQEIYSDQGKIRQILIHLMSNAAKFTSNGVISLDVSVNNEAVTEDENLTQNLVIHVNDTGIGMAQDSVEDMFRPFLQEKESYDRSHDGVGLGLVLTRNFVEMLGGTIKVDSEFGGGSNFQVEIPIGPN